MSPEIKSEIISWVQVLAIAVVFALVINNFVIVNAAIPTGSMENTIMTDSRIVAFRWSYVASDPKQGDIAVFKYPDDETQLYVKRVIGVPGDTIKIIDGKIFINNSEVPLDEPYLKEVPYNDYGPYTVPEGSYFMLGDNRNNSKDFRAWVNPYVQKDKILGKVFLKYYPKIEILSNK